MVKFSIISTMLTCLLTLNILFPALSAKEKDDGLILYYDFNEGSGTVAKDKSGNSLNGTIFEGKYVSKGKGYALKFDGNGCVRIPNHKLLAVLGKPGVSYTIEFWFKCPDPIAKQSLSEKWAQDTVSYPWAIRGPAPDGTIKLTIYDGKKKKASKASYSHPSLRNNKWHHLVAVRDCKKGKVLLYIDGIRGRAQNDRLTKIDVSNTGEAAAGARYFTPKFDFSNVSHGIRGQLDDFRIYKRALTKDEVMSRSGASRRPAHKDIESADTLIKYKAITPQMTLSMEDMTVKVGSKGAVQIDTGKDSYVMKSCFSYPGAKNTIGWNGLPYKFNQPAYPLVEYQNNAEKPWAPFVKQVSKDTIIMEAKGNCYSFKRIMKLSKGKIDFKDKFTNLRKIPTGIFIRHGITANDDFSKRYNVGQEVAANPTLFLKNSRRAVAMVMNDDFSRNRMRAALGSSRNHSGVQIQRFALAPGKSYTLSWSLYVMKEGQGYFDFLNRLRRDWNACFTLDGPFNFAYLKYEGDDIIFYVQYSKYRFSVNKILKDPAELQRIRDYFKWTGTKIISVAPWLDFDPGAMNHVLTWKEFQKIHKRFLVAVRKAVPQLRVLAAIETDYVSFRRKNIKKGDLIPIPDRSKRSGPSGMLKIPADVSKSIEEAYPEWVDSFVRDTDGQLVTYGYYRGGKAIEEPGILMFPEVGNMRYKHFMKQLDFAINKVGMDGVYCDDFVLGQIGSKRTYGGKWDGISGRVDLYTGKVSGIYKDCSIAGAQARANIMNYVLSRNKIFAANRHSTTRREQSIPAFRVTETGWAVGPTINKWQPGTKPPALNYLSFAQLSSALGLGVGTAPIKGFNRTEWLMRGTIIYLRHGMVFYYYNFREPRMNKANKDAFAIMKHMFPITPRELGEGFIIGDERILTAISLDRLWSKTSKPKVLLFNLKGKLIDASKRCKIKQENGKWRIKLELKDWSEVAVVE